MYSHLLDEIAYDRLTRAHNAARTLYFLLDAYGRGDSDGLLEAKGLSAIAEHILDDLRESLEGCEMVERFSDLYTPPQIQ